MNARALLVVLILLACIPFQPAYGQPDGAETESLPHDFPWFFKSLPFISANDTRGGGYGNLTGDAWPEVFIIAGDPPVLLIYNNTENLFSPVASLKFDLSAYGKPVWACIGDYNADGYNDIGVLMYNDTLASNNTFILLFLGPIAVEKNPDVVTFFSGAVPSTAIPTFMASSDFDRDGVWEFAVAFRDPGTNGLIAIVDGPYNNATREDYTINVGVDPRWVGFLNTSGSAFPDLVVLNERDNTGEIRYYIASLKIYPSPADITFATGTQPIWAAGGDVNGDGYDDLFVANVGSDNVTVYLTSGGTFPSSPSQTFTTANPTSVALGDLNSDGIVDMAVSERLIPLAPGIYMPGNINIFYGPLPGHGSTKDYSFPGGDVNDWLFSGYIDRDGLEDLLLITRGDGVDDDNEAALLLMQRDDLLGDYGIEAPSRFNLLAKDNPVSAGVGDFDGDGDVDIVVVNAFQTPDGSPNSVTLYFNNGGFSSFWSDDFTVGDYPHDVGVGNLNGGAVDDFVVSNTADDNLTMMFMETQQKIVLTGVLSPWDVEVFDINQDGLDDVVVGSETSPEVYVFLQNATTGFANGTGPDYIIDLSSYGTGGAMEVEPLLGIWSLPGLAVTLNGEILVLEQTSPGNFNLAETISPSYGGYRYLKAVDLDGDGMVDLIGTRHYIPWNISDIDIFIYSGLPYPLSPTYTVGSYPGFIFTEAADLNDDGEMDMAVSVYSIDVILLMYENWSNPQFDIDDVLGTYRHPQFLLPCDVTGDNRTDLIALPHGSDYDYIPFSLEYAHVYVQGDRPPVANATSNAPVVEGTPLTLDGGNSTDGVSDISTLNYTWYYYNGTGWEVIGYGVKITHVFVQNGTYDIALEVRDRDGLSSTDFITVDILDTSPVANFTFTPGIEGTPTIFNDTSTSYDGIVSWYWDFGDGSTATGPNVTHVYAQDGTYTVTLWVEDSDGSNSSVTKAVSVPDTGPTADFTVEPGTSVLEGQPAWFNDTSTAYDGIAWTRWDISDGTVVENTTSLEHIFTADGLYYVNLTVCDGDGTVDVKSVTITVGDTSPVVDFTWTNATEGEPVQFTAEVSSVDPIVSYYWEFGDGTGAKGSVVDHVFAQDGVYRVTLWVEDSDGSNVSIGKDVSVADSVPVASFVYDPSEPVEGENVHFVDTSESYDGIVMWEWDFGDGTRGDWREENHTYMRNGTYHVTLRVTDADGDVAVYDLYINVSDSTPVPELAMPMVVNEDEEFEVQVNLTYRGADPITEYRWDLDYNGTFEPDRITAVPTISVSYPTSGVRRIAVVVVDSDSESDVVFSTLEVRNVAPNAAFSYSVDGAEVTFDAGATTDTPSDMSMLNYTWDFGDGTVGYGKTVTHRYEKSGNYTVRLVVMDDDGAVSEAVMTVEVAVPSSGGTWWDETIGPYFPAILLLIGALGVAVFMVLKGKTVIDDVYLITKEGLLIHHATRRLTPDMDEDILSGMLVAIQEFVRDSFKAEKDTGIRMLEFGNSNIYLEEGEHLILAMVVRGRLTEKMRAKAREILSEIEEKYADVLKDWDGSIDAFRGVGDILERIWK